MSQDAMSEDDEYQLGFNDGWDACHKRFTDILAKFPLQCAMISNRLPLHPSQYDEVLEAEYRKYG